MRLTRTRLAVIVICLALFGLGFQAARKSSQTSADPLIAGFQKTTTASVADAVDSVVGKRGYMSHAMTQRIPGRVVGRALTALARPAPPEKATAQLAIRHSIEMIDEAKAGEVGVIVFEDGLDVAALGGLMATSAKARGMAGMILDGGLRDVNEIRRLGLPVYSTSLTPATAVGRYATVSKNEPVTCAGIPVRPGDIIVADEDGVVVVPQEKAQQVLAAAQDIDKRETAMVPMIMKYKSLQKVVQIFNRI